MRRLVQETRLRNEQAVLEGLNQFSGTGEWFSGMDLARMLAMPERFAYRAASRLAQKGLVLYQMAEWSDWKGRPRYHAIYAPLPLNIKYPAWLEPPWHPVDPRFARFVAGRAAGGMAAEPEQPNEDSEMTIEYRLQDLPRAVREAYNDLQTEEFANPPDVVACRKELERRVPFRARAVKDLTDFKARREILQERRKAAMAEIANLKESRASRLTTLLLAGDDLGEDKRAQQRLQELQELIEAIDLGTPGFAGIEATLFDRVRVENNRESSIQDRLDETIDRLRMAEAERRASS